MQPMPEDLRHQIKVVSARVPHRVLVPCENPPARGCLEFVRPFIESCKIQLNCLATTLQTGTRFLVKKLKKLKQLERVFFDRWKHLSPNQI